LAAAALAAAVMTGHPLGARLAPWGTGLEREGGGTASRLARGGVERALQLLQEEPAYRKALLRGRSVPGLGNDVVYFDLPGGSYRVTARFNKAYGRIRIVGTGRDWSTGRSSSVLLETSWPEPSPGPTALTSPGDPLR